jgi:hypothetical protein
MDIATVLTRKFSDTLWNLVDNDYTKLEWLSDSPKPTKAELEKLWPTVQAEIAGERQAKLDAKASAIAKLEALGLTVDEVQVAFGLVAE